MLKKLIKFAVTGGLGTITNLLLFFMMIQHDFQKILPSNYREFLSSHDTKQAMIIADDSNLKDMRELKVQYA